MTIAWMIYVLLVGGLLAVGAWCVEDALRAARRPTRWVWAAALLGTVAFAAYALRGVAPEATVSLTNLKVATSGGTVVPSAPSVLASIEEMRLTITRGMAHAMSAAIARVPAQFVGIALAAWAAASVVLLLIHLTVSGKVTRQRRAWPIATLPGGTARIAPALGPAVIGLASPEIVVPEWLLAKSCEAQRLVMVHEQEHIAARDQYLPFGALLVATLLPWHPAVWWSLARLRLAVELDCDARVLRRGESAKPYGTLLIDIAAQCGGHRVGAVALADRTSHLERRILAMTPRTSRFTRVRSTGLAAVAALAVITACEARLPTASEVQSMDVAGAEKALVQSKILDEKAAANVVYEVNGQTVTAESAHAIPSNRIATVNVVKGAKTPQGAFGPSVVRITTSDAVAVNVPMKIYTEGGGMIETPKGTLTRQKKFDGVLFVDGVRKPEDALSKISPDDIASVDVIKGEAARAMSSDPAAANGIIKVVTKAGAKLAAEKAAQ